MKKIFYALSAVFLVVIIVFLLLRNRAGNDNQPRKIPQQSQTQSSLGSRDSGSSSSQSSNSAPSNGFVAPISKAAERVTKKPFGIFITPQDSPVTPERFRGYHTGTDFEIFPEELNQDVSVSAVCDGILRLKEYASGYGGVAVEQCNLNGNPITIIYGHLKLASIAAKIGDSLKAGDAIGILGAAYSSETDGERKHLHLGFHKGTAISILGYVQNQSELSGWLDPCTFVCK